MTLTVWLPVRPTRSGDALLAFFWTVLGAAAACSVIRMPADRETTSETQVSHAMIGERLIVLILLVIVIVETPETAVKTPRCRVVIFSEHVTCRLSLRSLNYYL